MATSEEKVSTSIQVENVSQDIPETKEVSSEEKGSTEPQSSEENINFEELIGNNLM
jgi:hypothetical protein